MVFVLQICVTK